jgi:DNA primase
MSHDQNFKNLIVDYPREALRFFAAEEAEAIDATARIVPLRQEQLKARLGERFRELDVPLLVEWPDGRREALLFVLEEETDPRRFSIHRLAHYCLDLAELCGTDRVVPVVIFLGAKGYRRRLALGGDRHTYLSFRYIDCRLAALAFEEYRDSDNIVARLNLPNMAWPQELKLEVYAGAVRGLFELEPDPELQIKYLDFIDIYAALDDNERQQYRALYPEEDEKMATFSERFIQKGIQQGMQQGIQQGMQQGIQQGEARILLRQLSRRFGELPEDKRRQIESADTETLLEWSERVLTASSLDEVLH